uniref:Urotensin-2 n=1 Tax=Ictidomys tridecemlineatus TaxID=43179 RepID=A0A287D698_ICTTR
MYQLASCCLLFIGFLNPLVSLPVTDSRDMSLQLPAPEDDARLALEELERASILKLLPEVLGAAEENPTMNISNPRSHPRKAFPEEGPNIFLSQLLARPRKQHKQHGPPLECFWKYCV